MVDTNKCPGDHLIFSVSADGEWQLLCGETGDVLRVFKDQNDAVEYGIFLVSEHGPWKVEFKRSDVIASSGTGIEDHPGSSRDE